MKILVINGPNINMLGIREPDIYGKRSYKDLLDYISNRAKELEIAVDFYQSNHEGDIVDEIQNALHRYDAILINPAAYTHTSVAIADALKAVDLPAAEVHLSDPDQREPFRHISYVRDVCRGTFMGKGFESYGEALEFLVELIKH